MMTRYKTDSNGQLTENWDVFYSRNREMVEFKIRSLADGEVEVAIGDTVYTLGKWGVTNLCNCLNRKVKEFD